MDKELTLARLEQLKQIELMDLFSDIKRGKYEGFDFQRMKDQIIRSYEAPIAIAQLREMLEKSQNYNLTNPNKNVII